MDLFITLREAAELVRVSRPTLFRAVQRGELAVRTETVGKTKKILVSREEVQAWVCSRGDREQLEQECEQGAEQPREQGEQLEQVPLLAHLDLVRLLESTQLRLLDATERAHRAERQADVVRLELLATRNCLTEQAESIHEKEAGLRHHEELRSQNRELQERWEAERAERERQLAELEAENAARLSLYEQEKKQWALELETSRTRVNWLEKRVPRWVRGLFGAQ
jgi:excisionase family DNA binding protein